MREHYSENTMKILDALVESYGDLELSPEDAEAIFGGNEATTVKDLTTIQLIQYALAYLSVNANDAVELAIERTNKVNEMAEIILAQERERLNYKPNRAQRRAK
jgi:hypothetical protein